MATYIPGLTDQIPDLPLYQPDFGFLNQMLNKKTAMYEQGFSQVKNGYDSIANAPLTDQANQSVRDGYLKQAQDKLKNLSSTDLSMSENVDAASKVFAPFWEDDLLLMDQTYTKSAQMEMQKGFQLRDSKNKEERDQYSDIAMQYIANGLDVLKTAGRNPEAYKNLEKRRFVPFINEKEYWNTQAKTLGFEVNWSEPSGPYLINTKNGQRAEQSFRTFAEGMISPQMENQYKIIGTVEKEGRVKQVKSMFPGVTDTQALEYIAKDVVTDIRKNYQTAIKGLTDEQLNIQSKIKDFEALGSYTPAQENRYKELLDYQAQLADQIKNKNKEFSEVADNSSVNAMELHNNIVNTPEHYFTKLARSRSINNWAAAASSNASKKIEIDPAWKELNDVAYKQQQLSLENRAQNRDDAKYNLEVEKFEWEKTHPTSTKKQTGTGSGYTDPATGEYVPGKDDFERGDVLGAGTTDVTKVGSALDVFNTRQQQRLAVADDSIFSMEGLGRIAATLPGADMNTVVKYFSTVKRGVYNVNLLTPEEKEAKSIIDKALKEKTGITITGPGNLRNAVIAYSQNYFKDKTKDGGTGISNEDITSLLKYNFGAQAKQEYLSLENKKKELMKQQVMESKDPEIKEIIRDGEFMSKEQYLKSKLGTSSKSQYLKANPSFEQDALSPFASMDASALHFDSVSSQYDKLIKSVNEKIVPNIPEYNNQTGKMGVNFQYQMDGKITKGGTEKGTRLVQEVTQASNRDQIFVDGELSKDEEINKVITELGAMSEKDLEKYFSNVIYKTVGLDGKPSLLLKMTPIKSSDKTEVAGVDLNDLVGKQIEITLSPNATGPTINSLPRNEDNYIYNTLLRGKSLKSDPVMSAANFSYEIIPDDTANPTKAYVNIKRKKYNPKTGTYDDVVIPSTTIDFFGSNKKTPDELVGELYSMFQLHLNENKNNEQVFKSQLKAQGQPLKDAAQVKAEWEASRIGR